MGGGGGGKSKKSSAPPQAAPLDFGAIMAASSAAATEQIKQQYKSLIENYPELERLSLGTVQKLATNLGNQETRDAQDYIRRGLALGELDPAAADPTTIEQELYNQGERELALGRSLSPEQERAAQQSARAAFTARGLGNSMGSVAAEVLNRDAAASARERERQGFASAANDQFVGNITNRRMNLANMYFSGAGNLIAADPYNRAVGPGLGLAANTQGNQMQQIGRSFDSANQMAGNVASFNANMAASNYNSYMNNQAAQRAAGMQAGAMRQAGTMGMIGGIGQGVLGAASMFALSDKREKTEIKPLGKSGSILGLKTYSYKYKGDDKKRIGVMAQDVQKVLPEAVTEVEYKGKKRLAIKPAVIGAALAEELAAQAA